MLIFKHHGKYTLIINESKEKSEKSKYVNSKNDSNKKINI